MSIPKSFYLIPIQVAAGVTEAVNDDLDKANDLRRMFRDTFEKLKHDAKEVKRQPAMHQEKVH